MQAPYVIDSFIKKYRKTDDNFRTLVSLIIGAILAIAVVSLVIFVS